VDTVRTDQALERHTRGKQRVEPSATAIVPDAESATITVRWEWWRITQSQYHRREIGEINLGEIE